MLGDGIDTNPDALREISDSIRRYVETQYEIIREYLARMSSLRGEIETQGFEECLDQIHSFLLEMDSLKSAGLAFCAFLIAKAVMLEEQSTGTGTSAYPHTYPNYSTSGRGYYPSSPSFTASSPVSRAYVPSGYTSSVRPTAGVGASGRTSVPPVSPVGAGGGAEHSTRRPTTGAPTVSSGDRPADNSTEGIPKSPETEASKAVPTEDPPLKRKNRTRAKLPSQSFKRLMKMRGNDQIRPGAEGTLENEIRTSTEGGLEVVHGYKGDRYYIVSSKDGGRRGIYLTREEVENLSREEIIDLLALPPGNDASVIRRVELAKDQFIIVGKIKEQPGFAEEAGDGISRSGGGIQYITDGGFAGGAVREVDSGQAPGQDSEKASDRKNQQNSNNGGGDLK